MNESWARDRSRAQVVVDRQPDALEGVAYAKLHRPHLPGLDRD